MRVLVLDDAKAARMFLQHILQEMIGGIEIFTAADGVEGLQCLETHGKMALAFVDLIMPNMDGLEFIRAVRSRSECDDMPLIAVTTKTDKDMVAETLQAGADEYVMKPYTKEVIQDKLTILGFDLP